MCTDREEREWRFKRELEKYEEYIDAGRGFPVYEYSTEEPDQKVSWKSQYMRGGMRFKCPFCGWEASSHSYVTFADWERACYAHVGQKHPRWRWAV